MKKYFFLSFLFFLLLGFTAHAATLPTLTDKIDQLIMVGFNGTTVAKGSDIEGILKNTNVGGVLLFDYNSQTKTYGKNITTIPQLTALTTSLKAQAKTPLFIAIDEEGGQVSRLKRVPGFVPLQSAAVLGTKDIASVQIQNIFLATTLKQLGINVNFAPVLDLTSANKNAPLTKQARTFSKDPKVVAQYASAVIKGMNRQSIVSAGKHYPGLGEATIDTHKGLATITTPSTKHIEPYTILNAQGLLKMVMVGHVIDRSIDTLPASLSKNHMNILRNGIGFKGVIITDDLDMGAIHDTYTTGQATVRAIQAGADMVIISNNIGAYNKNAFYEARDALLQAVQNKTLSEKRITESYERIVALKKSYGILK